jgi:hypothetical protein
MKFYFSKNENGEQVEEEIVMVQETLDVRSVHIQQREIASIIALALSMYMNDVQEEGKVLNGFQKLMKSFSPWSSKVHAMRQQPWYTPNPKRD